MRGPPIIYSFLLMDDRLFSTIRYRGHEIKQCVILYMKLYYFEKHFDMLHANTFQQARCRTFDIYAFSIYYYMLSERKMKAAKRNQYHRLSALAW